MASNSIHKRGTAKVDIRPGPPVTPHQRAAWQRFWKKLIAEVKANG